MATHLLLMLVLLLPQAPAPRTKDLKEGRVTRIDGATQLEITPTGEKSAIKVSIAYLEAPERGQEGYREGEKVATRLLANRTIRFTVANTGPTRDGRTPAIILIGVADDYGSLLVLSGWARRASPQKNEYKREEETAQKNRAGIWAEKKP